MTGKVYHIKEIGDVIFEKNNRAKTLRITVKPNSGVKVSIPRNISLTNAFRFVEEKTDWIRKSLEKVKSFEQNHTFFKPGVVFRTRDHQLEFILQPDSALIAKVGKGLIRIFYNAEEQLVSQSGQVFVRRAIEFAWRKEAKIYLPERTKLLADKFGFTFSGLRIKNLKSRWGSCSSVNNINLNIHLMRLPDHLVDYVILHELVHTVHKNHGKHFWHTLDKISGDAKLLASEMKKYRTVVY
jgi:predicted metal-dependent hydrolase